MGRRLEEGVDVRHAGPARSPLRVQVGLLSGQVDGAVTPLLYA
jgi:hypothetical protein